MDYRVIKDHLNVFTNTSLTKEDNIKSETKFGESDVRPLAIESSFSVIS